MSTSAMKPAQGIKEVHLAMPIIKKGKSNFAVFGLKTN